MEGPSQKLSEVDICEFCRNIDIPVTESELKSPTREFMIKVLQSFVLQFKIDLNNPLPATWNAVANFENPDYYENAKQILMLTVVVNEILNPCGVNISIKDIFEPKPKRTKKIMIHLIVFFRYFLEKRVKFYQLEKRYEERSAKAKSLSSEIDAMREKNYEKRATLKSLKNSEDQLLESIAADEEVMEKYAKRSESYNSSYQDLKTQEAAAKTKKAAVDVEIANRKSKLVEFGQLILNSPDRMNAEITTLKERVKDASGKVKEVELKMKAKKKDLAQLQLSQKEACNMQILHDLKSGFDVLRQERSNVAANHEKITDEIKQCEKVEKELFLMTDTKYECEQGAAKTNLHFMKEREVLKETKELYIRQIDNEKSNYLSSAKQNDEIKLKYKDLEDIKAEKAKEFNAVKSDVDRKQHQIFADIEKIMAVYKADCNEIKRKLKECFEE